MILEAIVTTRNLDGSINVSPMGPSVTDDMSCFELRPFNTSSTFANLKRTREGILHVTDDVLLFARAAIGQLTEMPKTVPGQIVNVDALCDACRWYEFVVESIEENEPRILMNCHTRHQQRNRDFFGFNRAKFAVLEAAILATRIQFLRHDGVAEQFDQLEALVAKTGGEQEHTAFALLKNYILSNVQA